MKPQCCYIPCDKEAEWSIVSGDARTPDEYGTEACTEHVGALLDDSAFLVVTPIEGE